MRFTDNASIESSAMMTDDILAGTDVSEGTDKKFTLANLGAWFLENFNGTIGGKNQSVLSAIESKADAAGVSEELTAGTAGQLLSESYEENFEPYKFRKSPYTDRLSESIVGCSVAWNQLLDISKLTATKTVNGITITNNGDGTLTLNGTATAVVDTAVASGVVFPRRNHVVLINFNDIDSAVTGSGFYVGGYGSGSRGNKGYYFKKDAATDWTGDLTVFIPKGTTLTNYRTAFLVSDLTTMFGSTVADALYNMGDEGVNLFRSWYPNDYYPYTEATLEHVSGLEAHEMVGFNQWDEVWEVGGIDADTGENYSERDIIRSKNYIHVLPNTKYYCTYANGTAVYNCFFYDSGKNYISVEVTNSGIVTTPPNCAFMRFGCRSAYGTTYNHDICINLSDPTRNGLYKSYEKHAYTLDSSLMLRGLIKYDSTKGFYADGDTYAPDGTVTRKYGIVDLGTLDWFNQGNYFYNITDIMPVLGTSNWVCTAFTQKPSDVNWTAMEIGMAGFGGKQFRVKHSATSAGDFKTAVSGVYLVYEKSTVETESAEPYDAIQITDGTEEYVTDCLVPVGHESKYYENLRSKIEGLPTDFSAIICATEVTNKASRNYAVGDYLIYGNTLYKVTTAIASDATLTVGTNITATTIMAEIKALQ